MDIASLALGLVRGLIEAGHLKAEEEQAAAKVVAARLHAELPNLKARYDDAKAWLHDTDPAGPSEPSGR